MNYITNIFSLGALTLLLTGTGCQPSSSAPPVAPAQPAAAHPETGRYQIVASNEGDRGALLMLLDTKEGTTWIYRQPMGLAFNGFWSDIPRITLPASSWERAMNSVFQQAPQPSSSNPPPPTAPAAP